MASEALQILLAVLGVALWLVGGNFVLARYYRSRGTSLWAEWKPFSLPWAALAATWRQLLVLAAASVACLLTAMLL